MSLLSQEEITRTPIQDNEAGIVLKADGSFEVFNTYTAIDLANLTEQQVRHGELLMAFALICKVPEVRQMVLDKVDAARAFDAPNVIEFTKH